MRGGGPRLCVHVRGLQSRAGSNGSSISSSSAQMLRVNRLAPGGGAAMRAVILAAGRGGRLEGVIGDQARSASRGSAIARCSSVRSRRCRSAGTRPDHGRRRLSASSRFSGRARERSRSCRTPGIASTNSLYSLWLARDLLLDGFVVLNCDVLFHPQMLDDLLTARYDDALLVARAGRRGAVRRRRDEGPHPRAAWCRHRQDAARWRTRRRERRHRSLRSRAARWLSSSR